MTLHSYMCFPFMIYDYSYWMHSCFDEFYASGSSFLLYCVSSCLRVLVWLVSLVIGASLGLEYVLEPCVIS